LPESRAKQIKGLGKSVFLGGGAAGILSIFPVVNLLNLFFMLWIALGAAMTVYLLAKENPGLGKGDAFLAGALSGLVAGAMFAFLSLMTILGITQEKLEALLEKAKTIAPLLDADMTRTLQGGHADLAVGDVEQARPKGNGRPLDLPAGEQDPAVGHEEEVGVQWQTRELLREVQRLPRVGLR